MHWIPHSRAWFTLKCLREFAVAQQLWCSPAKCPVAQPSPCHCVHAALLFHCLPWEDFCHMWELHTWSIFWVKSCWREPLGNDLPGACLISGLVCECFVSVGCLWAFLPSCWKKSSYKREWSLFSFCENPLTHVSDRFASQDSQESSQSILVWKELCLLLKSFLG